MKLRYSPTSPFVRKVMITAIETGQAADIEPVPTNPWAPDTDLGAVNPVGQVPALQAEDGRWLYDSWVICDYLDSRHTGDPLTPASGDDRFAVMTVHSLANGTLNAGIQRLLDGRRPENERSPNWVKRQTATMARGLDAMEAEADGGVLGGGLTMADIAVGCTLGWFDFRFPDDDWRASRPCLADFYDTISNRASFLETVPKEPA
jgi:glutathione S-transferase